MEMTSENRKRLSSSLKLVHAAEKLRVNPSCISTLRYVLKCLSNVEHLDIAAKQYVSLGFLDVIPSVLTQRSMKVVTIGLEILGALSLSSSKIHHQVLTKEEIIRALVEIFTSSNLDLLTAAFHTLEDVLITSDGLERFKHTSLVENLMRLLCLLADLYRKPDSSYGLEEEKRFDKSVAERGERLQVSDILDNLDGESRKRGSKRVFGNELESLVDSCVRTIVSINPGECIKSVPRFVYFKALGILYQHWSFMLEKDQLLYNNVDPTRGNWYRRSKSRHELAKCLVLLGMEYDCYPGKAGIVDEKSPGISDLSSDKFMDFWERLPVLVTKAMPSCLLTFAKRFNNMERLFNLLYSFTTCPSSSADEVDSFMSIREIECTVGDPLSYGRDIRIVKTVNDSKVMKLEETEVHFFSTDAECTVDKHVHPKAMLDAVKAGFSLAIKGLELRCADIARLSEALAKQFGQPSVGVNLYVTPPNAQGLAVHFDDHCVLVCQLHGKKSWKIFPPAKILPRLYASRSLDEEALNSCPANAVTLEEGNVLYIPRGFPHKAFCDDKFEEESGGVDGFRYSTDPCLGLDETSKSDVANLCNSAFPISGRKKKKQKITPPCSDSLEDQCELQTDCIDNGISVHLTFGVEVEPPFEWEGMVHIALRLWILQRWGSVHGSDSKIIKDEDWSEALLHVAIRNLGENDIRFRKACMIAAEALTDSCIEKPVNVRQNEKACGKNLVPSFIRLDAVVHHHCSLVSRNFSWECISSSARCTESRFNKL
ncbi:protein MpCupin77 [Marchantia polymorpha subsp. ruderalis]|uniref:Bifunctional lysine-specific demethylase and histidyl-hydroxylase n=2 Tax=Marchantia polymorpha TaxID=3197 RepID=A0AAF6BE63_MARPO|nr:hypothetical protein MARPO_0147s0035 [Marchantia polymorpha]BBN10297.1 hypothetical protein Mp_5g02420 [Marchantia polymorpha subsp. ruderalis]|eukprot:PTQ29158.1 hypothetical protein MARPO_0147s0035 [Marchantia polymorpha]